MSKKQIQQYASPKNIQELLHSMEKCKEEIENDHVENAVKICKGFMSALKSINIDKQSDKHTLTKLECIEEAFKATDLLVTKFLSTKYPEVAFELNFWQAEMSKKFIFNVKDHLHKLVSISYGMNKILVSLNPHKIDNLEMEIYFKKLDDILQDIYKINFDNEKKCKQVAWYLANYGLSCFEVKRFAKAIEMQKKGISIMEYIFSDKAQRFKVFGHCHANAARALEVSNSLEEALIFYKKALEIYDHATDFKLNGKEKTKSNITSYIERVENQLKRKESMS